MVFFRLIKLAVWALAWVKWEPWLAPNRLINRITSPDMLRQAVLVVGESAQCEGPSLSSTASDMR